MNHFDYRDGILHAEDVSLPDIAREVGTPFYCYSTATLERHYKVFTDAFSDIPSLVCYAMKANSNQAVLATLARLGSGADVVSEGELRRARAAGIPADKILFSGVGKTAREIDYALEEDILCFNVESEPELEMLSARAATMGKTARVSFRINPDVDAKTHEKIASGWATFNNGNVFEPTDMLRFGVTLNTNGTLNYAVTNLNNSDNVSHSGGVLNSQTTLTKIEFITGGSHMWLDNVSVMQQVPEPSAVALFGLGGLALILRRRK